MYKGARSSAVVALLVIVAGLAIAACGSSSSSSSANASATTGGSSTTSTGTSTTGGPGGRRGGFFTSLTATQKACLKSHGVMLPTGGGRGFRGRGGTGTFTRPSGTPTGGFGGGTPPAGTSTTGGPPTGAGGFGGGGFGGGASSKYATAFKDCDITVPTGGFGGRRGPAGSPGGARPTAAALKTFVACVDSHGYALKDSQLNTTGTGSILPKSLETNKAFLAAATPCEKDLFSGGGAAGAAGGGASGGTGTAATG